MLRAGARERLRAEDGATLIELMATMAIGMVTLLGAFFLLDSSVALSGKVTQRAETVQRARHAMDLITRELRSQVCLGKIVPIVAATATSVEFYADLGDGTLAPGRRTLTFTPGSARLTESVRAGTLVGTTYSFADTAQTTTLLEQVGLDAGTPMFRYYAFDTATPPAPAQPLTTLPLSVVDRARVAKIEITFAVRPTGSSTAAAPMAVLQEEVYARNADPNTPAPAPVCQ